MIYIKQFPAPAGFKTLVGSIGIKDPVNDFACIFSSSPCSVSGMFSQSLFAGPSVQISRNNLLNGNPKAVIVISKNANVATGIEGYENANELINSVSTKLKIAPEDIIIASTGIIGRPYPMDKVRAFTSQLSPLSADQNFYSVAKAIMTTDTVPKIVSGKVGDATIIGVAKGVGMVEPNMATMLAFFFTDAMIPQVSLDRIFRKVINTTFNCLSIDTDTSTSDTAVILANGKAGKVSEDDFESSLHSLALSLVKKIARDGEGATKLIEVTVYEAKDYAQAKRVGKAIINSPLVKTAIHGADPNWGRIIMAIGKCEKDTDILVKNIRIKFSNVEIYPNNTSSDNLEKLVELLKKEDISISVYLGCGRCNSTVWGCDLSAEYVRINAEYST